MTRAQTLFDDPLAGCSPLVADPANAQNLLRSLLLRLRLFYSEKVCDALTHELFEGGNNYPGYIYEFILNEMMYELRVAKSGINEMYEKVILDSWIKQLMKKVEQDAVLEFVGRLKKDREKRSKFTL